MKPISRLPLIQDWLYKFLLHIITGVAAVAIHYGVMALFLQMHAQPLMASSLGFFSGAAIRFYSSYFKVFSPSKCAIETLPKFSAALGLQFVLNSILLTGFLHLGFDVWWAQAVTTILLTISNYVIYRLWVFR